MMTGRTKLKSSLPAFRFPAVAVGTVLLVAGTILTAVHMPGAVSCIVGGCLIAAGCVAWFKSRNLPTRRKGESESHAEEREYVADAACSAYLVSDGVAAIALAVMAIID